MTITIETLRCIDGPSLWSAEPVTQLLLGLGPPEDGQPDRVRILVGRLSDLDPVLVDLSSLVAPLQPLPFPERLGLAGVLGTLALNIQRTVGVDVVFSASRPTAAERVVEVVVQHDDAVVGAAASRLAIRLLSDLNADGEPDMVAIQTAMARFGVVAASRRYGTAAQTIVASANERGIPVSRVDPSGRIVELGNGAYRRRILNSLTSLTSVIGDAITADKSLTNHYLRTAGLPVPEGAVARTVEQAVAVARTVGYPVVVKPVDLGASAGLSVDVRHEDALRTAFAQAAAKTPSGRVLVEEYVVGNEYRALVANDQVISVSYRVPAHIVGDGRHTIRRLIEIENADPRRGTLVTDPLRKIVVDAKTLDLLERQHLDLEAIPPAGRHVQLRPTGNVPLGGLAIDRTDAVHPDNAAILRQATNVVGLDIASIDLIAHDISESMWATSGAILEINARAGFRHELNPSEGQPRDAGPVIIDMLFPPGRPVRAPILAVIGDPQSSPTIARHLASILTAAGEVVGLASSAALVIDGRPIRGVDVLDPTGVRTLLNHPSTEILLTEVNPQEIVAHGLGFPYCTVAVVTALSGLTTPFGQPVESVLTGVVAADGALVLNADDPSIAALARSCRAPVVLVSRDSRNGLVCTHVERGGQAVVVRPAPTGDQISLVAGETVTDVVPATAPPSMGGSPQEVAPLALLAAVAAAVARDVPLETIRRGLA